MSKNIFKVTRNFPMMFFSTVTILYLIYFISVAENSRLGKDISSGNAVLWQFSFILPQIFLITTKSLEQNIYNKYNIFNFSAFIFFTSLYYALFILFIISDHLLKIPISQLFNSEAVKITMLVIDMLFGLIFYLALGAAFGQNDGK